MYIYTIDCYSYLIGLLFIYLDKKQMVPLFK